VLVSDAYILYKIKNLLDKRGPTMVHSGVAAVLVWTHFEWFIQVQTDLVQSKPNKSRPVDWMR